MCFLNFYSHSWLKSIGSPSDAAAGFQYFSNLSWNFLWIATLILLILANILLWKTRKAWALWATFAFFSIFVILKYFWLNVAFSDFNQSNNLPQTGIAASVFSGVFYSLFFAVIVFFDQFIVLRLSEKMHPQNALAEIAEPEIITETDETQPEN